jgi:peptidyl-prolyl cis-trans isomerase D
MHLAKAAVRVGVMAPGTRTKDRGSFLVMLDTIRRAQPAIIKGVLGAVVIAFVATIFLDWGWRRPGRPSAHVATISGEVVSLHEFEITYNNLVDLYRRMYQDRFTEDLARTLNLKEQALDTLIQRKLLLSEAKRQGLTVTDAELIEKVQSYPVFQVDGGFDRSRYLQVLRFSRLTPGDFEHHQREEILLAKLENLIKDGVQVTESEMRDAFLHEKEKVNVEYLRVEPDQFAAHVEVSEPDVATYYQQHQELFRKPEQVRVAYVVIAPEALAAQLEITDERLAQYYEEHKEDFRQEEQVRARHILFKLPQQATAEEEAKARAEAEAVLTRIQGGEDFAEVASQISQDPASAQQGGDLGFFRRGEMVKSFEDVAFALQPGEVSAPVRTDFGYHLIKAEAVQEAGYRPLDAVREELRVRLTAEEARRQAQTKAQEVHDVMVAAGGEWETAVRSRDLVPRQTSLIARGQGVEEIENPVAFTQAAFALDVGEISQPISIGNRYIIMKLLERKISYLPPFEEVRATVQEHLVRERAMELARQKAEALLSEVKTGKSLEELAQMLNIQAEQTGMFSRDSTIPKLGHPPAFIQEAFRMSVGDARVIDLSEQPAVMVLRERQGFDAEAYEQEKAQLQQRVVRQRRDQTFAQWAKDLRRQAEERHQISINPNLLAAL